MKVASFDAGGRPITPRAFLREMYAALDKTFAETGDPVFALQWIATAAKTGVELPPNMARWLHDAVQTYIRGDATMDQAMGLASKGTPPRRRHRAEVALESALGDMWFLVAAGASHTQAATLVAARTGRSVEQLVRSYVTSWYGKNPQTLPDLDIEELLRQYPDREVVVTKGEIRRRRRAVS